MIFLISGILKSQTCKNRVKWWLAGDDREGIGQKLFKVTDLK